MKQKFDKLFPIEECEEECTEQTETDRVEDILREKASGEFTKKVIIVMGILLVIFVIVVMVNFIRTGLEPGNLIIGVFSLFTGQFGAMAWLMKNKRDTLYREISTYREGHNLPMPLQIADPVSVTEEDPVEASTIAHHSNGDNQEDEK